MIPFDFQYHAPESIEEAVELYTALASEDKNPLYYGGGTEIISFSRRSKINTGAVIDLKKIPDTVIWQAGKENLAVGAALPLSIITDQDLFPLLARVARPVADRTVRNRLTLGGNICGRLPYREALLPFLLGDSEAVLAGPQGSRTIALTELFNKRLLLEKGEFLVKLLVPSAALQAEWWHKRREKHGPVDYPLVHLAVLRQSGRLAVAVSGLCSFPFRETALEDLLNDRTLPNREKVDRSLSLLPGKIRDDDLASAAYREKLWRIDLEKMLEEMEGVR